MPDCSDVLHGLINDERDANSQQIIQNRYPYSPGNRAALQCNTGYVIANNTISNGKLANVTCIFDRESGSKWRYIDQAGQVTGEVASCLRGTNILNTRYRECLCVFTGCTMQKECHDNQFCDLSTRRCKEILCNTEIGNSTRGSFSTTDGSELPKTVPMGTTLQYSCMNGNIVYQDDFPKALKGTKVICFQIHVQRRFNLCRMDNRKPGPNVD